MIEYIDGKYTRGKPVNITGIDKIRLKEDSTYGFVVKGIKEPTFYDLPVDNKSFETLNFYFS